MSAGKTERKLSTKQQRFVDFFNGNATEAARLAGYSGSETVLGVVGVKNIRNGKIAAAIQAKEAKFKKGKIKTLEEIQTFWTDTIDDTEENMQNRLKAAADLTKAKGGFIERAIVDTNITISPITVMKPNNAGT